MAKQAHRSNRNPARDNLLREALLGYRVSVRRNSSLTGRNRVELDKAATETMMDAIYNAFRAPLPKVAPDA